MSFKTVYEAYAQAGGKLDAFARKALGQQARKLVTGDGFPIEQVAKAAGELARSGNSAAFLGRIVREMPVACVNGPARSRLTQGQLSRCPCASCAEWHRLRAEKPLAL